LSGHRRVEQQPAYILHYRPFRDSSQILDVFSRDHGKLALIARGSRGARSRLKGILRPFMPLSVSWVLKSDLGTLTGAEVRGAPLSLTGDALLSGYYVNELLINFLHRHDPQPDLFDTYTQTLLSLGVADNLAACLRQFELRLLRHSGYALSLGHEAGSQRSIEPAGAYEYKIEQGPVAASRDAGPMIFSGEELLAISREDFDEEGVLRAANRLLRAVIAFHLGGKELKTRKVLVELHRRR
jgi:DNA repair protein RecO (recombination protein O)